MSNYIKVLKRLEQEKRTPALPPATAFESELVPAPLRAVPPPPAVEATAVATAPIPTAPVVHPIPAPMSAAVNPIPAPPSVMQPAARPTIAAAPPVESRRHLATTSAASGIATLLENLRVLATGRRTRTVVFSGASLGTAVELVATSLAAHAKRAGSEPLVVELAGTGGRSLLVPVPTDSTQDDARSGERALAVDLDAGVTAEQLHAWTEQVAPTAELVILLGPPLTSSIDAALLACACDGLVIVAESEVTARTALQVAAERARVAGCRTLGVVMHGTKDHLPKWIHRLMGASAAPTAS